MPLGEGLPVIPVANSSKYPIVYRRITLWVAQGAGILLYTVSNNNTSSITQISRINRGQPPRQQGANQPSRQQVVGCPHCRRHLLPPPGAPRFRCPCGRILEISVGHNFLLQQASQPEPQQQRTTLVRCPRCSLLLRAPPGAPQFRCPCGILLALQGNGRGNASRRLTSWQCHLCSHSNSVSIGACVMCGAQKQLGARK